MEVLAAPGCRAGVGMTAVSELALRKEIADIAARRPDVITPDAHRPCPPHAGLLHRLAALITTEDLPPAQVTITPAREILVDCTGQTLVENTVRRWAAALELPPVTEAPFDVDGFAATLWSSSGYDGTGSWRKVEGYELLPTTDCPTCPRSVSDWPAAECETPEAHEGAIYDCDCGDTVTIEQAIADPRRHRRCNLIGSRS